MTTTGPLGEMRDDVATLWLLIRRVAALLDRESDRLIRSTLGISLAQFLVLSVVDAHPGPMSQQVIADRLGLTKGTVSRQIEAAVAAGLMSVRTAAHTRREHDVTLTAAGTALVRTGDAATADSRRALFDVVDPEQIPVVNSALHALLVALER